MLKIENPRDVVRDICSNYGLTLSIENQKLLAGILEPQKLLRGQSAVVEGDTCRCMYYVTHGLVLMYYKRGGQTITEGIIHEREMLVCVDSFFRQVPSTINVTMLEPSVLYGIPYDKLYELGSTSFELCRLIFAIEQRLLLQAQQRADCLRFDTAKERYVRLLRENPEVVRRAPLHHVASLLQIASETLSRVRNQVNMELY